MSAMVLLNWQCHAVTSITLQEQSPTMKRTRTHFILAAVVSAGVGLAFAEARAEQKTIGTHGEWTAFTDKENGKPLCYIGSAPKKAEGAYTSRGATYVLVSIRPAEASNGVVTVEAGYSYKPDSKVNVDIDGAKYELYTRNRDNDKKGDAWAVGNDGDKALIAAMKSGKTMVVKGTSSRGTLTTDTYSLAGFSAAYNAIDQACRSG
jgi:invasion protein IalB